MSCFFSVEGIREVLQLRVLWVLMLIFSLNSINAQDSTFTTEGGDWALLTWGGDGDPGVSGITSDVSILTGHKVIRTGNLSFHGGTYTTLHVFDTLIIFGNLSLGNNPSLNIHAGGVVIIIGDYTAGNRTNVSQDGYLIVTGSFTDNSNNGDFDNNNPDGTYIFNPTKVDGDLVYGEEDDIVTDPIFEYFQEIVEEGSCLTVTGYSTDETPLLNDGTITLSVSGGSTPYTYSWSTADGGGLTAGATQSGLAPGVYNVTITDNSNPSCFSFKAYTIKATCCPNSLGYYSEDNITANWEDVSTWASPDEGYRPLPPPTDGASTGSSQIICINGTITLNGDYTVSGSNQYLCDTLIVTGNFYANNPTFSIEEGAVLIVLGDYIGTSGTINNGGKVVFAGDFTQPYDLSGSGTYYVFDPTPSVPGWFGTTTYDESEMQVNDGDLYDFFQSVSGGSCSITALATASPASICFGESATLTASGGTAYSWSTTGLSGDLNATNIPSPIFTPSVNPVSTPPVEVVTFTVTVSDGSCSETATVDVTVYRRPETGPQYHIQNNWSIL